MDIITKELNKIKKWQEKHTPVIFYLNPKRVLFQEEVFYIETDNDEILFKPLLILAHLKHPDFCNSYLCAVLEKNDISDGLYMDINKDLKHIPIGLIWFPSIYLIEYKESLGDILEVF